MKSKKILIIDTGYLPGSGRVPITAKISYWQKQRWAITILTTNEGVNQYKKEIEHLQYLNIGKSYASPNRVILIGEFFRRIFKSFLFLPTILRGNFQVVYSISSVTDLLILPLFVKILQPKIIWGVIFDNAVFLKGPGIFVIRLLAYLFYRVSLILLHLADAIFYVSPDLKTDLVSNGINSKKLTLTGNGVEEELVLKAKARFGPYDAAYMGRVNETKGIYDLLEVMMDVKKKFPQFKMAILGSGDSSSEMKFRQEIKLKKLSKHIDLIGFVSGQKKYDYLRSARLFIFLSPQESFGVALLEAVSVGLPAIVYDLPAYKHLASTKSVQRVRIGDVHTVSKKVIESLKSTVRIKPNKKILNQYSWDNISKIESDTFIKLIKT